MKTPHVNSPRTVYPSNGGLKNPAFNYRTDSDLKTTFREIIAARPAVKTVRRPTLVVDQVLAVKRFGGN